MISSSSLIPTVFLLYFDYWGGWEHTPLLSIIIFPFSDTLFPMMYIPSNKHKNISMKTIKYAYQSHYSNIPSPSLERKNSSSTFLSLVVFLRIRNKHKNYDFKNISMKYLWQENENYSYTAIMIPWKYSINIAYI